MRPLPAAAFAGVCAALTLAAAPAGAGASPAPGVRPMATSAVGPQNQAAKAGADWLAGQVTVAGYVATKIHPTRANLSSTAQIPMALAAANVAPSTQQTMVAYLAGHVDAYVTVTGSDGPGKLAALILDAHATGTDPSDFGGTDLVSRLLATEQTTGPTAGLFGDQAPTYTGVYRQGLALAALRAVGETGGAALAMATRWLVAQQCPDGGWSAYRAVQGCTVVITPTFTVFMGPDTNDTALALEALSAEGALSPAAAAAALGFLEAGQNIDGGWGYYPSGSWGSEPSDPNSTSVVIQGLSAMGQSATSPAFAKPGGTPSAFVTSEQLTSGPDAGAFVFPVAAGGGGIATVIATYQSVPALAGVVLPFGPTGASYWAAGADGGVFAFGLAGYYGSLPQDGVAVDDIVSMAGTPDGRGYLLFGADGGVYAFGDAAFKGSLPAAGVAVDDVVAGAATADGGGYWLIGADGGVFAFGDAGYFGSLPSVGVSAHDLVGIVPTPDGGGYWVIGADGGVFAFGDAPFAGSLPALHVSVSDIVGAVASPDGAGYLLTGADGGVFAFGDAGYYGSLPAVGVTVDDVVATSPVPDGAGYVMAAANGGIFCFGGATFSGSLGATPPSRPWVAVATSPARAMG